jgi:hypothetical protein
VKKDDIRPDGRYVIQEEGYDGGTYLATAIEVGIARPRSKRADGVLVELNEPRRYRGWGGSREDEKIGDRRVVRTAEVEREPTEEDIAAFERRQHVRDANAETAMLLSLLEMPPAQRLGRGDDGFVLGDDGRAIVPIDMLREVAEHAAREVEGDEAVRVSLEQVQAAGPAGFLSGERGGSGR